MSPMSYDSYGNQYWYPKSNKDDKVYLGKRNEEEQFMKTVEGTARMMQFEKNGIVSEDDVRECIAKNAQHLGIEEDYLTYLASQVLEQNISEENDSSETGTLS